MQPQFAPKPLPFVQFAQVLKSNNYELFTEIIKKYFKEYDIFMKSDFELEADNWDLGNNLAKDIAENNYNFKGGWDDLIKNEYLNLKCNNIAYVFYIKYGLDNNLIDHEYIYKNSYNFYYSVIKAYELLNSKN
jgi:hypothetical protein